MQGKVIVITGASRGIGRAAALQLAAKGAHLVLVARSEAALSDLCNEVAQLGGQALSFVLDVTDHAAVKVAIDEAHESFGRLDVVINNAGVLEPIGTIDSMTPEAWMRVIDVNLKGAFNVAHAALPSLLEQESGVVINVSSGAADRALLGWSHYCASKAALKMLTQSLHLEYAEQGLLSVGFRPGTVATEMMQAIKTSGINAVSQIPWEFHLSADEAAQGLVFLCGEGAAKYAGDEFSLKTEQGRREAGLT